MSPFIPEQESLHCAKSNKDRHAWIAVQLKTGVSVHFNDMKDNEVHRNYFYSFANLPDIVEIFSLLSPKIVIKCFLAIKKEI